MKRILPFLLVMLSLLPSSMIAQKTDDFFIEGELQYFANPDSDQFSFKLINPYGQGIHFSDQGITKDGNVGYNNDGIVGFTFKDAVVNGCDKGFSDLANRLVFYQWSTNDNKWVERKETTAGEMIFENSTQMIVILVLDCSSSLGISGFNNVKESAKN